MNNPGCRHFSKEQITDACVMYRHSMEYLGAHDRVILLERKEGPVRFFLSFTSY